MSIKTDVKNAAKTVIVKPVTEIVSLSVASHRDIMSRISGQFLGDKERARNSVLADALSRLLVNDAKRPLDWGSFKTLLSDKTASSDNVKFSFEFVKVASSSEVRKTGKLGAATYRRHELYSLKIGPRTIAWAVDADNVTLLGVSGCDISASEQVKAGLSTSHSKIKEAAAKSAAALETDIIKAYRLRSKAAAYNDRTAAGVQAKRILAESVSK